VVPYMSITFLSYEKYKAALFETGERLRLGVAATQPPPPTSPQPSTLNPKPSLSRGNKTLNPRPLLTLKSSIQNRLRLRVASPLDRFPCRRGNIASGRTSKSILGPPPLDLDVGPDVSTFDRIPTGILTTNFVNLSAGSLAGLTAVALTYPLDLVR